jgi:hypothetical protein
VDFAGHLHGRDFPYSSEKAPEGAPVFRGGAFNGLCKMIPGEPNSGGTEPVDLPEVRVPGVSVILVADDNGLVRNVVGLLMQRRGASGILSAADGCEGLDLSRQYSGTIDLVITDVEMPRMNGTDLCGHLLEERPGIKVLVMSWAMT